jgi:hypothetical protein
MSFKFLFTLVLCIMHHFILSQTCIIAKKEKNAIYIGTDARVMESQKDSITQKIDTAFGSTCKIFRVGKFNFAGCGQFEENQIEIAKDAARHGKSFSEVMRGFEDQFAAFLKNMFDYYSRTDVPKYLQLMESSKTIRNEIIFFGFEQDSSVLAKVIFAVSRNADKGGVRIAHGIVHRAVLYCGQLDRVKDTIENKSTWKAGIAQTISDLLKIETTGRGENANNAVYVLKLEPHKTSWIPARNACSVMSLPK